MYHVYVHRFNKDDPRQMTEELIKSFDTAEKAIRNIRDRYNFDTKFECLGDFYYFMKSDKEETP